MGHGRHLGLADATKANVSCGMSGRRFEGTTMKTEHLAGILVRTGLVHNDAVEDPENFDGFDTMGRISEAAALVTAAQIDSVKTGCVRGRCVEAGDDDTGQPMLLIHTTREQLMAMAKNVVFADVEVYPAPTQNKPLGTASAAPTLPASEPQQPPPPQRTFRVGDKYHRAGMTVEITSVTDTHVEWEISSGPGRKDKRKATVAELSELENNTLRWGGVFEPAKAPKP